MEASRSARLGLRSLGGRGRAGDGRRGGRPGRDVRDAGRGRGARTERGGRARARGGRRGQGRRARARCGRRARARQGRRRARSPCDGLRARRVTADLGGLGTNGSMAERGHGPLQLGLGLGPGDLRAGAGRPRRDGRDPPDHGAPRRRDRPRRRGILEVRDRVFRERAPHGASETADVGGRARARAVGVPAREQLPFTSGPGRGSLPPHGSDRRSERGSATGAARGDVAGGLGRP